MLNGAETYVISPQVLSSLVRISTHSRIYQQPSLPEEAWKFCWTLMSQPTATLVSPLDRHWAIFESLCRQADARGNLVQDVWIAALAIEWGCEWITLDRDFARLKGLRWRLPFEVPAEDSERT